MRLLLLAAALLLAWSCPATAQQRWIIDSSNSWQTDRIFQQAAPGDVILIRLATVYWGTANGFLRGKGVTIRGDLAGPTIVIGSPLVANVPAGQSMALENFWLQNGLRLSNCVGSVVLRHTTCRGSWPLGGSTGLTSIDCSQVHLLDCTLQGSIAYYSCGSLPNPGLAAVRSRVTASRCTILGSLAVTAECIMSPGSSSFYWVPEGAAIEAEASSLALFDTHVERFHPSSPGTELANTRFLASPPPMQWILGQGGTPASDVHLYGQGASAGGSVVLTQNSRLLPTTRATLTGDRLRLEVRNGGSGAPGFLGIGLSPAHVLLAPYGHHGALLVPTDRGQSALFDTFATDATGSWMREYVVPPMLMAQLVDRYFIFQALMLDPQQTIWAGSPDIVRF